MSRRGGGGGGMGWIVIAGLILVGAWVATNSMGMGDMARQFFTAAGQVVGATETGGSP